MIEEENDEDILKKSASAKGILKNLFVILLIMLGALIIYFGNAEDPITNWMIGFMLICVGSTLMQIQKPAGEPIRQTLTILVCSSCGLTTVRNFNKGDFVFNQSQDDTCTICSVLMEIKQIYSVKLKQAVEPNKKEEAPKGSVSSS